MISNSIYSDFVNYINVLVNRNGAQIFSLTTVYKYFSIKMTES